MTLASDCQTFGINTRLIIKFTPARVDVQILHNRKWFRDFPTGTLPVSWE
jgi:hypothetical protein